MGEVYGNAVIDDADQIVSGTATEAAVLRAMMSDAELLIYAACSRGPLNLGQRERWRLECLLARMEKERGKGLSRERWHADSDQAA